MRVLFISANTEPINMPVIPLGLYGVASYTERAGHDVKLLDLMNVSEVEPVINKEINDFNPDIIGISIRNIDDQNSEKPRFLLDMAKDVISTCRSLSSAPIVVGGAGYSLFPESALEYLDADYGIQGEGEIAFLELIKHIEKGKDLKDISSLYLKGQGKAGKRIYTEDLDLIPLPDAHLIPVPPSGAENIYMPVQSRRGCPLGCSYCSTATIEGKITRKRSPKKVVEALLSYKEIGFNKFYFTDNTFNIPPSYAMALCNEIIRSGLDITWRCIFHPVKTDYELLKLMYDAGCREISLGFESGSTSVLRHMNKSFTPHDVIEASKMLKNYGIIQMGFLLLGGPGETKETVIQSLEFADSLKLDSMRITTGIRIYPDTALERLAREEGVISPDDDLLYPRFYIVKKLEDWLRKTIKEWAANRPHWIL